MKSIGSKATHSIVTSVCTIVHVSTKRTVSTSRCRALICYRNSRIIKKRYYENLYYPKHAGGLSFVPEVHTQTESLVFGEKGKKKVEDESSQYKLVQSRGNLFRVL